MVKKKSEFIKVQETTATAKGLIVRGYDVAEREDGRCIISDRGRVVSEQPSIEAARRWIDQEKAGLHTAGGNTSAKMPTPAAGTATKNFFEKYGEAATMNTIVGRLLRFNKFGEFRAGQEDDEIEEGTRLIAFMPSLCAGWMHWVDSRPVDIVMGPIGEGFVPPRRDSLGDIDPAHWPTDDDGKPRDPWQLTNTLILVNENDHDDVFTFSTSSKGGLSAIGELSKLYGKHMRLQPGEVPVIELGAGSYRHRDRTIGEIRFPILKVIGWFPVDKLPPIEGAPGSTPPPSLPPSQTNIPF